MWILWLDNQNMSVPWKCCVTVFHLLRQSFRQREKWHLQRFQLTTFTHPQETSSCYLAATLNFRAVLWTVAEFGILQRGAFQVVIPNSCREVRTAWRGFAHSRSGILRREPFYLVTQTIKLLQMTMSLGSQKWNHVSLTPGLILSGVVPHATISLTATFYYDANGYSHFNFFNAIRDGSEDVSSNELRSCWSLLFWEIRREFSHEFLHHRHMHL